MKPEILEQALEHISDRYIEETIRAKKHRPFRWVYAAAAVLVLVMVVQLFAPTFLSYKSTGGSAPEAEKPAADRPGDDYLYDNVHSGNSTLADIALSQREAPRLLSLPDRGNYKDDNAFLKAQDQWLAENTLRNSTVQAALDNLLPFFRDSSSVFLESTDGSNKVWSPLNGYIALAMLAEITGGSSSGQILDVLGVQDTDQLRQQVSAVWESVYFNDEHNICIPENSLWLDQQVQYHEDAPASLAHAYYASTYQTDFTSEDALTALQAWLNESTGGFLNEYANDLILEEDTVLLLASTIHMQAQWQEEFSEELSSTGTFHTPSGDLEASFLNKKSWPTHYYQGSNYGAVCLSLRDGSNMWLFLPNEGSTPQDILLAGQYLTDLSVTSPMDYEGCSYVNVNLSVPKFDVSSSAELTDGLKALGITHVFDADAADFSPLVASDLPVRLATVQQAARVSIDEKGADAASYMVMMAEPTSPQPPTQTVQFTLDRPFLFVLEKEGIPLFTGVVNQP